VSSDEVQHVLVFGCGPHRVVIATPEGPATGFTPRHSRNLTAVTHSIIPDRYDKFGSSSIDRQKSGSCSQPAEAVLFGVIVLGAVAGVVSLATGAIEI
jgi:hypothetical protein